MIPLSIKDLHFAYEEKIVLNGIGLELERGKILSVIGLSGCGKSTLCYCICGIIPHIIEGDLSGKVEVFGKDVRKERIAELSEKVGIVFQNPDNQLFSPTVEDEVAFGPENLCVPRQEISKRIEESLKTVGMDEFRERHPHNLSGGEKQLIAIASVLAMRPEIMLFDESLSQIDDAGSERIKEVIVDLKKMGKSILTVEHDLKNLDISDEVFLLDSGRLKPLDKNKIRKEDVFYKH
jgi:energy-coupling factor transport system ATP-binding protein